MYNYEDALDLLAYAQDHVDALQRHLGLTMTPERTRLALEAVNDARARLDELACMIAPVKC